MKSIAVCALVFTVVILVKANDQHLKLQAYIETCLQTYKKNISDFEEFQKALSSGQIDKVNNDMRCFAYCFMQKMGVAKEDGKFNKENARAWIHGDNAQEKFNAMFDKCDVKTGKDACDTSFQIFACFVKEKAMR